LPWDGKKIEIQIGLFFANESIKSSSGKSNMEENYGIGGIGFSIKFYIGM
jgi:hypothetical protein